MTKEYAIRISGAIQKDRVFDDERSARLAAREKEDAILRYWRERGVRPPRITISVAVRECGRWRNVAGRYGHDDA